MRCVDFERRLQRVLDARMRPERDRALRSHASQCPSCLELLEGQELLFAELAETIPPITGSSLSASSLSGSSLSGNFLSAGFTRRVVAQAAHQPAAIAVNLPPTRRSRRHWPGILAVSAAVAVILFAMWPAVAHRLRDNGNSRVAQSAPGRDFPATIAVLQRPLTGAPSTRAPAPSDQPASATVSVPPSIGASSLSEIPAEYDAAEYRQLVRGIIAKIPEMPDSRMESIDRIAGGFRPLATTLEAAWDTIRRTIPVGREATSSEPQARFPAWYADQPIS